MDIVVANESDLEGILALQAANQPECGGTLSAKFSREQILAMRQDMPILVARHQDQVMAFLMTSSKYLHAEVPIIQAMLAAYSGFSKSYVYGPICVAESVRGKGVAQALFAEVKRLLPGREGILFIRCDNPASMRAHIKLGMIQKARFQWNDQAHVVLSYQG